MKTALSLVSVAAILLAGTVAFLIKENQNYRQVLFLNNQQFEIFRDEIRELQYNRLTARTYEQGYNDALVQREAGSFNDGYIAARNVYLDKTYADGYHTAMKQFGWTSFEKEEKLSKKD